MLSDNQIAGIVVVCLLVGGTIAVYGVNLLAWIDGRDNRCIGDLAGEGLTPEPTSLPWAAETETAIDQALELGLDFQRWSDELRGTP